VAVEYFIKWVEAKPLTNVSSASIKKFFWQNIICYYGVPRHITVDNAKYFDNAMFKDFCHQIGMKAAFASVYHHQTNGLIFDAIKKNYQRRKERKWVEVMPQIVWSHNTIVCRATNFTLFWLMYRAEAILLEEVKHRSLGTETTTPACPCEDKEKDLLESDKLKAVANLQKIPRGDKSMERPEGQFVGVRGGQLGNPAKPSD
jgi:hypothetical protein